MDGIGLGLCQGGDDVTGFGIRSQVRDDRVLVDSGYDDQRVDTGATQYT